MTSRRRTATAVVALALASAVLLGGCADGTKIRQAQQPALSLDGTWRPGLFVEGYGPVGLGPQASAAPTATASPSAASTASPSAPAAADAATQTTLAGLGLVTTDFAAGYTIALIDKGDTLSDPTLDFCGKTYDSEKARTARHQVVLVDPTGVALGVFTEAVLYRTPADAAAALTQLRTAVQSCSPTTPVTYGGAQVLVTQTSAAGIDVTGFVPEADRVAIAATVTNPSTQRSAKSLSLYQVRGRALVGLYYQHAAGDDFTAKDLTNFHYLGSHIAGRLDQLPPTVVGTS